MSFKWKLILFILLVAGALGGKYFLFDMPIGTGYQVGVLKNLSHQGAVIKTWDGSLLVEGKESSLFYFSVRNDQLARELLELKEQEPLLEVEYQEFRQGWPRKSAKNIVAWKVLDKSNLTVDINEFSPSNRELVRYLGRTLFCSLIGSLHQDQELYQQVKDHLKEANPYLYQQYSTCND